MGCNREMRNENRKKCQVHKNEFVHIHNGIYFVSLMLNMSVQRLPGRACIILLQHPEPLPPLHL